jgi:hypothetical protein
MYNATMRTALTRGWAPWRRFAGLAPVAVSILALEGCASCVTVEREWAEQVRPNTAAIVIGETDRAEVHQLFGKPWLAGGDWDLEVFRASKRQATSLVLVRYDLQDKVAAYDQGTTGGAQACELPKRLDLKVGSARLTYAWNGSISLIAEPIARDEYLARVTDPSQCTVMVGFTATAWVNKLSIDGQVIISQPDFARPGLRLLTLAPGSHRIAVPPSMYHTLEVDEPFSCAAGERSYAAIQVRPPSGSKAEQGEFHWRRPLEGAITVSGEMPEPFRDQPLLIWQDGTWLVPHD